MPDPTLYVVYNKTCNHVAYGANERPMATAALSQLTLGGRWGWRIRVATDDDLVALMAGDRCDVCTFDGQVSHVARA